LLLLLLHCLLLLLLLLHRLLSEGEGAGLLQLRRLQPKGASGRVIKERLLLRLLLLLLYRLLLHRLLLLHRHLPKGGEAPGNPGLHKCWLPKERCVVVGRFLAK
jgi:hypothetical protein